MARVALLFFVLAVAAGIVGYGGMAGAFASLAVLAFYICLALLLISLLAGLLGAGNWRNGGPLAGLAIAALFGAAAYAWIDHGMSAQRLGAALDQNASRLSADATDAVRTADAKTRAALGSIGRSVNSPRDGAPQKGPDKP